MRDALENRVFVSTFQSMQKSIHEYAHSKGWWEKGVDGRNQGEQIALMHSELSEALEAIRHKNPPSEHIPEFSGVEEELADVIIRIMDFSQAYGFRTAEAILVKQAFNEGRAYKHGGKEF